MVSPGKTWFCFIWSTADKAYGSDSTTGCVAQGSPRKVRSPPVTTPRDRSSTGYPPALYFSSLNHTSCNWKFLNPFICFPHPPPLYCSLPPATTTLVYIYESASGLLRTWFLIRPGYIISPQITGDTSAHLETVTLIPWNWWGRGPASDMVP